MRKTPSIAWLSGTVLSLGLFLAAKKSAAEEPHRWALMNIGASAQPAAISGLAFGLGLSARQSIAAEGAEALRGSEFSAQLSPWHPYRLMASYGRYEGEAKIPLRRWQFSLQRVLWEAFAFPVLAGRIQRAELSSEREIIGTNSVELLASWGLGPVVFFGGLGQHYHSWRIAEAEPEGAVTQSRFIGGQLSLVPGLAEAAVELRRTGTQRLIESRISFML